jgi:glycosyltransferase involved in cell wall biosynthesis
MDNTLRQIDLYSLIAASDCYVSLHRSEGFGLTIAEAMYLGKPVIATGYSGNMEFMNVNNSLTVRFKLVELEQNDYVKVKMGSVWAEPDIDHAAELMLFVFENRQQANELGKQGCLDIKTLFSPEAIGRKIRLRMDKIAERVEGNHGRNSKLEAVRK